MKIDIEMLAQENPLLLTAPQADDYALRSAYLDVLAKEIEAGLAAQGASRGCEDMSRDHTTKVFTMPGTGSIMVRYSYHKNPDQYQIEIKGDEGIEAALDTCLNKRYGFVERHTTF